MSKIDLVYLWCNDQDPVWRTKRMKALNPDKEYHIGATDACRVKDNHELMYSLRSVEMYAPWIRKVYIVTDNQTPEWLDTSNPQSAHRRYDRAL